MLASTKCIVKGIYPNSWLRIVKYFTFRGSQVIIIVIESPGLVSLKVSYRRIDSLAIVYAYVFLTMNFPSFSGNLILIIRTGIWWRLWTQYCVWSRFSCKYVTVSLDLWLVCILTSLCMYMCYGKYVFLVSMRMHTNQFVYEYGFLSIHFSWK